MTCKLCGLILSITLIACTSIVLASNKVSSGQILLKTSENMTSQTVQVNINSADVATLQKIKGMSKKKAQAIIDYRVKNGPFKSFEEILQIKCRGIHKDWLDKIRKFLTL